MAVQNEAAVAAESPRDEKMNRLFWELRAPAGESAQARTVDELALINTPDAHRQLFEALFDSELAERTRLNAAVVLAAGLDAHSPLAQPLREIAFSSRSLDIPGTIASELSILGSMLGRIGERIESVFDKVAGSTIVIGSFALRDEVRVCALLALSRLEPAAEPTLKRYAEEGSEQVASLAQAALVLVRRSGSLLAA